MFFFFLGGGEKNDLASESGCLKSLTGQKRCLVCVCLGLETDVACFLVGGQKNVMPGVGGLQTCAASSSEEDKGTSV